LRVFINTVQEIRRKLMLTNEVYDNYVEILKSELVPALGCTEPIAIAYAAAKAKDILGRDPKRVEVWCSGNIIKNVKGVTVPNTGSLKGINAAAIAGTVGGNSEMGLQVLENISNEDIKIIKKLLNEGFCETRFAEAVDKLYISAKVFSDDESAEVCIKKSHTNICKIIKNGVVIFEKNDNDDDNDAIGGDRLLLNIKEILEFANTVNLDDVSEIISNQICMNTAISEEGLRNHYGVAVGKTLLKCYGNDVKVRAKARAAAGSDALCQL
jgi:L-cysteine desulfidase